MKKLLVLGVVLLLAACGSSFDEEGFASIQEYANDIIPVMSLAVDDPSEEYANQINEINAQYWEGSTFNGIPDTEIEDWLINMSRGDNEWTIEGEELADMLYDIQESSSWLAEEIEAESVDQSARAAQDTIQETNRILGGQ
ncbi:hypothetical protein M3689_05580 [Alkalihalophilus marmarensis]|uniref:hypothetical protein n=1 Tax=Alkalihalophilus marmarensis TaxID=521377 RepID=UPI00203FC973|nr:hypothetical protein [Alkalihalophilus marmarensis]MCM3488777.1 hypothetical protein [Alkalihalophilus marmarensis]